MKQIHSRDKTTIRFIYISNSGQELMCLSVCLSDLLGASMDDAAKMFNGKALQGAAEVAARPSGRMKEGGCMDRQEVRGVGTFCLSSMGGLWV